MAQANNGKVGNNMINLNTLPWIDYEDKDAVYHAVRFLPEAPVIIEAGGCAAEDTLRFKDIWPDSIVYAFEPNPDLFKVFTRHITILPNNLSKTKNNRNIHLSPLALADVVGEKTFNMSAAMPAASSFFDDNSINVDVPQTVLDSLKIKREEYIPTYKDTPITVRCTTIDAWREKNNIGNIDYIWLDTEGAELMILTGAINTLKTVKVISLEFNFQEFRKGQAQFEDVYNFLINNGFKCHVIWRAHEQWQAVGVFTK